MYYTLPKITTGIAMLVSLAHTQVAYYLVEVRLAKPKILEVKDASKVHRKMQSKNL